MCTTFNEHTVKLLLEPYQQTSISQQERKSFETWLKRKVVWADRNGEAGESLLEARQRKQHEYERKLWQQAEADPNIRLLQEKLGCRLVNVRPPETSITNEDSDITEQEV